MNGMDEFLLSSEEMSAEAKLQDVRIRERQLEAHLLGSPDYLRRAHRQIKRNVVMLYVAIALILLFQGLFTWRSVGQIPGGLALLTSGTSLLAIVNCLLIIRTKKCLRRLNEAWLKPTEKTAIDSLRHQRSSLLENTAPSPV